MKNNTKYKAMYNSIKGAEIFTSARNGFLDNSITMSLRPNSDKNMIGMKMCSGIMQYGGKEISTTINVSSSPERIASSVFLLDDKGNPIEVDLIKVVNGVPYVKTKQS